jgi:hypothetical protein
MKIDLPENYTIEIEVSMTKCFGIIFHPDIHNFLRKIGYFIAIIKEEDQTFNKHLLVDLCMMNYLKFDSVKKITVDASKPQGAAGPYDKDLLKVFIKYQKSDLPAFSSKLPNYIVDVLRRNFLDTLNIPIGLSLWKVSDVDFLEFLEHGSIWK